MTNSVGARAYRRVFALLLFAAFTFGSCMPALAGTTGGISGTITGAASAPVSGAKVTAVSPSGRYVATTDAKGFFALAGVQPDTYAVVVAATGYDEFVVNGVTVFADQTSQVSQTLTRALRKIGNTTARSTASAYQPNVPQNTYNVGPAQIQTQLGKKNATSESQLIVSLPGATLDSSGYPVLRGGRENEEGFQFEGIDYTDAFTNQFVNTLALNNPGGFQLTPGAGDASSGNTGTGVINLLTKRGTYPGFGSIDLEVLARPYAHQVNTEYGFATPNGKFSNYTTFLGANTGSQFGEFGKDDTSIGTFFSRLYQTSRDIINNSVFKFGKDNNQSIQALYQNQDYEFRSNRGGIDNLAYKTSTADPYTNANYPVFIGLTKAQAQQLLLLYPGQTDVNGSVAYRAGSIQPNETIKLQYSISPNSSSYYTAKFYKVNATVKFDGPYGSVSTLGDYRFSDQGGLRTGFAVDGQRQLNDKHLVKVGGKFELLTPVFGYVNPVYGAYAIGPLNFGFQGDFLPGGYLAANGFPYGTQKIPAYWEATKTLRQDSSLYINDTFTPTSKLKFDIGLRMDRSNYRYPDPKVNPEYYLTGATALSNDVRSPSVLQPRMSFAYQLGRNDAIRGSYARTVEMPALGYTDYYVNRDYYQSLPYSKLAPSPGNTTGCGINSDQTCANYGEQLFWANQMGVSGIPIEPLKPETFTNFDFSYSHQFGGNVALRITPFYRRGYDAAVLYSTIKTDPITGAPVTNPVTGAFLFNPSVSSNLGINRTTGVEFYLTKDNPGTGLSGTVSATYINEFSNVIPLSASEDFFPTIPAASALAGKVYRVGFLSPFQIASGLSYKFKSGFRVNPILSYNIGYPINTGKNVAVLLGSSPFSVPNTNVTSSFGASSANAYVDPNNPGSVFSPNIAATRGTPESNDPGGILSARRLSASMTLEFSPPRANSKGPTYGLLIGNLFNQLYGQPSLNSRWQPVATGIGGPQTGKSSSVILYPGLGFANYTTERFGQQPYIISPNNTPRTYRFYYQYAL